MTGVQDGNAAREIEILTAFDIPDPTIFRPLGENWVNLAPRREERRYDGAALKRYWYSLATLLLKADAHIFDF